MNRNIIISDISIQGTTKTLTLETRPSAHFCPACGFKMHSLNKHRRVTNATDMLIVLAFRNLMETSTSIANHFHVSDSYVHEVFDRYVKMDRLPLTEAICIDEVYLLKKYKWLTLRNQSNITYHTEPRRVSYFRCLMNTFDYEDALFRIDPNLRSFR